MLSPTDLVVNRAVCVCLLYEYITKRAVRFHGFAIPSPKATDSNQPHERPALAIEGTNITTVADMCSQCSQATPVGTRAPMSGGVHGESYGRAHLTSLCDQGVYCYWPRQSVLDGSGRSDIRTTDYKAALIDTSGQSDIRTTYYKAPLIYRSTDNLSTTWTTPCRQIDTPSVDWGAYSC